MTDSNVKKDEQFGFFRLDPVPRCDELSSFYQSQYYELIRQGGRAPEIRRRMEGGDEAKQELRWLEQTLFADVADYLDRLLGRKGRVLDVGAGVGDLVGFLGNSGFSASGIEPSEDASAIAIERGLDVSCATLEAWAATPHNQESYDAVVLVNVLEHVPDPLMLLSHARKLLKSGGVLCVRVPNDFSELQRIAESHTAHTRWWVFAPDHINYFDFPSLSAILQGAGYQPEEMTADFPMELFLLMGMDYVGVKEVGRQAHKMRKELEHSLPQAVRQNLYRCFAAQGMGRNILAFARNP
ncbi:MAG: class I SAM-dependent methyltransferase [Sulfuricella sp.]|nr:class I SAM-dependent methyltransferase [Sulfuricella sp.]